MLEAVKKALRIAHGYLDEDIIAAVETAKAEMVRAGVAEAKAEDESDQLIATAIKTYCLSLFAPKESERAGYETSWLYQLDCIRKSFGNGGSDGE